MPNFARHLHTPRSGCKLLKFGPSLAAITVWMGVAIKWRLDSHDFWETLPKTRGRPTDSPDDSIPNPTRGYSYRISDAIYTHAPLERGGIDQIRPMISRV